VQRCMSQPSTHRKPFKSSVTSAFIKKASIYEDISSASSSSTSSSSSSSFIGNNPAVDEYCFDPELQPEIEDLHNLNESTDMQLLREQEFVQDISNTLRLVEDLKLRHNNYNIHSIVEIEGRLNIATDFVTAVIGLNRSVFNRKISCEEKRKLLFVSDQIMP
jgi:hypothetical protein